MSPVRAPGPDRVTFDLFTHHAAQHDGSAVTGDDIVRSPRGKTKDAIRRRLQDMNEQFESIHQMSSNMEHDFKNTKLVRFWSILQTKITNYSYSVKMLPDTPLAHLYLFLLHADIADINGSH